jgi:hypothetical protein
MQEENQIICNSLINQITMNKINSYQIGSGSPLNQQDWLEESWSKVREDMEMKN